MVKSVKNAHRFIAVILILSMLISCSNRPQSALNSKESKPTTDNDVYLDSLTNIYNDIVETILKEDSTAFQFESNRGRSAYLQHYFVNNHNILDSIDTNVPPVLNAIYRQHLKLIFEDWKEDSLAIASQTEIPDTIFIRQDIKDRYYGNPTILNIQAQLPYYSFFRPMLSADGNTAIVYVNLECPLCGHGMEYILKKNGSRWSIIKKTNTWIS